MLSTPPCRIDGFAPPLPDIIDPENNDDIENNDNIREEINNDDINNNDINNNNNENDEVNINHIDNDDNDDMDNMPALVDNFEPAPEHVPPWHVNKATIHGNVYNTSCYEEDDREFRISYPISSISVNLLCDKISVEDSSGFSLQHSCCRY